MFLKTLTVFRVRNQREYWYRFGLCFLHDPHPWSHLERKTYISSLLRIPIKYAPDGLGLLEAIWPWTQVAIMYTTLQDPPKAALWHFSGKKLSWLTSQTGSLASTQACLGSQYPSHLPLQHINLRDSTGFRLGLYSHPRGMVTEPRK